VSRLLQSCTKLKNYLDLLWSDNCRGGVSIVLVALPTNFLGHVFFLLYTVVFIVVSLEVTFHVATLLRHVRFAFGMSRRARTRVVEAALHLPHLTGKFLQLPIDDHGVAIVRYYA
jgi:hypothetical protein